MKRLWKFLLASPAIFATMLVVGAAAVAGETSATPEIESLVVASSEKKAEDSSQDKAMAQVTSVSQLSDVQPQDWAFQALQSLVERYGCIAGYPNGTYRGNRAMTRYEFAAGLNACLDRVNELIATATADLVAKQDLATLQRLQEEFAAELTTLRGRVDAVEAKNAELQANQFSTTTKLAGEVVTVVSDVLRGDRVNDEEIREQNTTLGTRVRLDFNTSFTGEDELSTRIEVNNILSPDIGTPEGNLLFAGDDGTTIAALDTVYYKFPIGERTEVIAIANGGAADDVTNTVNLFDGDGSFGALSSFGTRNPIYYQMDGAGLGITQEFGDALSLSLAYLASSAFDPTSKNGLFDGPYGALAQLTFKPSDRITIGLTYINAYRQVLATGSNRANLGSSLRSIAAQQLEDPNISEEDEADDLATISNSYGLEASIGISDKFILGGWVGYTNTRNLTTEGGTIDRGDIGIWNYAVTLGFPDLGKKGNLGGIIFGVEPKVTSSSINGLDEDEDTSYHIEAFYQYQLTDNIAITPGVIWLTAPDHNNDNDDVVIGAVRTTFSF